jgi:hypothetical protein
VQHCLHASKALHSDRATLAVGPVRIEIVTPLQELRLIVEDDEIGADLRFVGRHFPIEEPRFIHRFGPRAFMDYTRMSQAADVSGSVHLGGERIELIDADGLRDRSWGVRPIGMTDPQLAVSGFAPQFFWLWTPVFLPGRTLFWHFNADEYGRPWNTRGVFAPHKSGPEEHVHAHGTMTVELHPGTRWARSGELHAQAHDRTDLTLRYTPVASLEMQGIGYSHPTWAHGLPHGELAIEREIIRPTDGDPQPANRGHRQLLCRVEVDGADCGASGILEHFFLGPYQPLDLG